MGLLKVIRKTKLKDKEIRILILGLDNAGKTTILKSINNEDITKIEPTVGFNIKSVKYNEYILNFWDVGGQESIRLFWRNYFENTDALIWVIDSVDTSRLNISKREIMKILKNDNMYKSTVLIFANKQDIKGSLTPKEINQMLELDKVINDRSYMIFGTSAVEGNGILTGIEWLINDINTNKLN
ncbi:ADP-ribosylation factor, putative [Theileria annulata]|uniref:ADP-ribosylation factor, putative n=1 Tax=Theileria annulata TaxID=5874 RepID=Q4UCV6_THEAN|nr:ADP-ribosylation factor, putative [Theileria annulata]CAI75345.1 ADP-ribosylation factor, putative [Theileria annulata]|eukprot:XP_954821.1 ADP-ribosylation factor, putative [Theileria annulata]